MRSESSSSTTWSRESDPPRPSAPSRRRFDTRGCTTRYIPRGGRVWWTRTECGGGSQRASECSPLHLSSPRRGWRPGARCRPAAPRFTARGASGRTAKQNFQEWLPLPLSPAWPVAAHYRLTAPRRLAHGASCRITKQKLPGVLASSSEPCVRRPRPARSGSGCGSMWSAPDARRPTPDRRSWEGARGPPSAASRAFAYGASRRLCDELLEVVAVAGLILQEFHVVPAGAAAFAARAALPERLLTLRGLGRIARVARLAAVRRFLLDFC